MDKHLLSVCLITYNHAKYIRKAIESVLAQKVNFSWEFIIADDFSTDGTREILFEYKWKYPNLIRLILQEKNVGPTNNFVNLMSAPNSQYTAYFEGDDFWTDPLKLQKQVDFLDENPQCTICFTNGIIVDENNDLIKKDRVPLEHQRNHKQSDIISGYCLPSNTIMFRTELLGEFPEEFYLSKNGDYFLSCLLTNFGYAGYLDENTAAYRIHAGGAWSQKSKEYQCRNSLKTFEAMRDYFSPLYKDILDIKIKNCKEELAQYKNKEKEDMQPQSLTVNSGKFTNNDLLIPQAIKNIVISGTNFWNPGDDFVRDGVIKILKTLFPDNQLNFLFYNFNQDFFPQNKFSGIHNMVSAGDLNSYKDFIDAVVIAGLSAGTEIKDLYNWIIENQLTDRVYLIGAGYENDYVDKFIKEEPELTIFRNAKIITGRTDKRPQLVNNLNLPYHFINCPAILSVENVKTIPENKKIEKIAFSIQLPHGIGVLNHSCNASMYEMSIVILSKLYGKYEIELIAHHKSEYFHFLNLFKQYNLPIKVIFSSFYQDLFDVYPRYDLVITTRLHASLFANGFGIPGIIINDTIRHTHCLKGFQHSHWVNANEKFWEVFEQISNSSLYKIAQELKIFKQNLLEKYVSVLLEPFGIKQSPELNGLDKQNMVGTDMLENEKLIENYFRQGASGLEVKKRVYNSISLLERDYWLEKNIKNFQAAINRNDNTSFDTVTFLNWFSRTFKPKYYLEIGVRRGRSMIQVLSESTQTSAVGVDMWIEDYSSIPEKNIYTSNPGPEFVLSELKKINLEKIPQFFKGNSHEILPGYFNDKNNIQYFDLILVDGDHSYEGARKDLEICINHLSDGGVLIFDDITHVSHPELKTLWNEIKNEYPNYIFLEDESGSGTGILIKSPFNKISDIIGSELPEKKNNPSKTSNKEEKKIPVHFFTIVLNGMPFIEYHINVFNKLPFDWYWHIVEGVAGLKHDTAWSLEKGGKIIDRLHKNGLSNDGTTEYLDNLQKLYPNNITVYRKSEGKFWDGKLEMVNEPLRNIHEECLLWQVDSDELWTAKQICDARNMFIINPNKTAAFFYCCYFVGEKLVITTKNTYGNHVDYEWLRAWHYKPGDKWLSHEPPVLSRQIQADKWVDLGRVSPFLQGETRALNLVFQHYSYATEGQLMFKEIYYGYTNAVSKWKNLNAADSLPVCLKDYFDWVTDGSIVDNISGQGINLLAKIENNKWTFNYDNSITIPGNIFKTDSDYTREAETAISSNDLKKARRLLNCALNISETNFDAKNDLAVIEILDKNYETAANILADIIKADVNNKVAVENLLALEGILKNSIIN